MVLVPISLLCFTLKHDALEQGGSVWGFCFPPICSFWARRTDETGGVCFGVMNTIFWATFSISKSLPEGWNRAGFWVRRVRSSPFQKHPETGATRSAEWSLLEGYCERISILTYFDISQIDPALFHPVAFVLPSAPLRGYEDIQYILKVFPSIGC